MRLALKYSFFAGISMLVNLLSQHLIFSLYSGHDNIYFALCVGTIFGLLTKYILDKKFIFYFRTITKVNDIKKFLLYSALGILTTIIFWSFELGFYYFWGNEISKYLGAMIGLAVGYYLKYYLDKSFVFIKS